MHSSVDDIGYYIISTSAHNKWGSEQFLLIFLQNKQFSPFHSLPDDSQSVKYIHFLPEIWFSEKQAV